ncbi:hypothetical protein J6590_025040 [Homalodisca vitripennis]|nr:hypothetical protein J6590_025040 [Homalodisca vitripennis]
MLDTMLALRAVQKGAQDSALHSEGCDRATYFRPRIFGGWNPPGAEAAHTPTVSVKHLSTTLPRFVYSPPPEHHFPIESSYNPAYSHQPTAFGSESK